MVEDTQAYQHYLALCHRLDFHNHNYYVLNKPTITDGEYDQLLRSVKSLEANNPEWVTDQSPTQRVGSDITGTASVRHDPPMLSLDNAFNADDIGRFIKRTKCSFFTVEPKVDGLAVKLVYVGGMLAQAATRGDGVMGEDITENVKAIGNIPNRITDTHAYLPYFEIRGEAYVPAQDFEHVNAELVARGEEPYLTQRSMVAGVMRSKDPGLARQYGVRFVAYDSVLLSSITATPKQMGFETLDAQPLAQAFIHEACLEIEARRLSYSYPIDGAVIKVPAEPDRQRLGTTAKFPRWAMAYKFEDLGETTVLRDVIWQTSKAGSVSPVGILGPVQVGGVMVSRVNLHNLSEIGRLDLHVYDTVKVCRSGDVTPKIQCVDVDARVKDAQPIPTPVECSSCHTELTYVSDVPYCKNDECPAQLIGKILHYGCRKACNIQGLGEAVVTALVENRAIRNVADLYNLSQADLESAGLGERRAVKLLEAIDLSRKSTMAQVLFGLSIPNVGRGTARQIENLIPDVMTLFTRDFSNLLKPSVVEGTRKWFGVAANGELLRSLHVAGVQCIEGGG